jgi:ubiquinone/menaquinone biosynthesis C-methylase UbiE
MDNLRARMFNRKASSSKSRPDEVLQALALKPGETVADIGSGGGYFTWRFAQAVGRKGKVYAVDTNRGFLEFVAAQAREKGLNNVVTVSVLEGVPALPEKVDLVFMRNVYHHLPARVEYFRKLRAVLKPGARVVIIDYHRRRFGHYTAEETIMNDMAQAGYKVKRKLDFLAEQSFTVFTKAG